MLVTVRQINTDNGWPKSPEDDRDVAINDEAVALAIQRTIPEPHLELYVRYASQLTIKVRGTLKEFMERIDKQCAK